MHIRFVKLKCGSNDRPDLQSTSKVTSGTAVASVPRRTSTSFSSTWIRAMLRSMPREPPSTPAMRPVTYSKITAPNSCAATGTASAIRHMMGIKEAVIMVPFNKDDEAPPWKSPTLVLRGTCSRSFRNWAGVGRIMSANPEGALRASCASSKVFCEGKATPGVHRGHEHPLRPRSASPASDARAGTARRRHRSSTMTKATAHR